MTTRQYLRFTASSVFGVIASARANITQLEWNNQKENFVAVAACENIIVWNLKTKEKCSILKGETSAVTCLVADSNQKFIAAGYDDGIIRIFDLQSRTCTVCFSGHKTAVSCLAYDDIGFSLASGGKDSEIVIWNVPDEAGLFRLKGHKGPVTKCHFFQNRNMLISSSKDTFIKFWDLDTQHCFQTLVGNRNEILDFIILNDNRLITGVNEADLKVWELFVAADEFDEDTAAASKKPRLETNQLMKVQPKINFEPGVENDDDDENEYLKYKEFGKLLTLGNKTVSLHVDKTERLMGCHAGKTTLQLFKLLNTEEISKKFRKRKLKEKKLKEKEGLTGVTSEATIALSDQFQNLKPIRTKGPIHSFSSVVNEDTAKISILLKNNSIAFYTLDIRTKDAEAVLCNSISLPGHRSTVRTLSCGTDNYSILSASEESVKIWKSYKDEKLCTRTMPCDFALSSMFLSGNSHYIIGTKSGKLQLFDSNSQECLESIESHEGSVNCMHLSPNETGIVTGSSDKDVKFWEFKLVEDENYSRLRKRLSLQHKRTLKMNEEILAVLYSPNYNKLAVSLLDNTVQVLFADTLKLAFSLYGHVLPVTCMDISYDSALIATGSEDKDIRIWSMEFGSCNKFLKKAHDKGITCLEFIPKTHMFFTGGRDHVIKQWDADNFQKIITLKGHQSDLTAFKVSSDGTFLISASRDMSIRIWEKTREPLVLEEEQEMEREEEMDTEELPLVPGEVNKEVGLPGLKTMETIKTADQLMEAIDVYKEEISKIQEHERECKAAGKRLPLPLPHPLLVAFSVKTPVQYMRKVVERIKSSELEGTLLYLPFNYVLDYLKIISDLVERGWATELCTRCTLFLTRIHMGQILSTPDFRPVIEKLQRGIFDRMQHEKDLFGFALAATQCHQRAIEAVEDVPLFTGILDNLNQKKKKHKKKERHIVTLK